MLFYLASELGLPEYAHSPGKSRPYYPIPISAHFSVFPAGGGWCSARILFCRSAAYSWHYSYCSWHGSTGRHNFVTLIGLYSLSFSFNTTSINLGKLLIFSEYLDFDDRLFCLVERKQAMTKSNAKSRNGQTKTLSPASVSSPTKGKGDKKGKGDGQQEKTLTNNSNGKIKFRSGSTVKSGTVSEVYILFSIHRHNLQAVLFALFSFNI